MFTGIIEKNALVEKASVRSGGFVVAIARPNGWRLKPGDSIAVSGVCSTVAKAGKMLEFFYMPETLKKTYFARLKTGDRMNLERSLKVSGRLDGHIVLGHVDATGTVAGIRARGSSRVMTVNIDNGKGMIAEKGSVAIEGISLTAVEAKKNRISVHIIPHTWQHTNLFTKKTGDAVNIEFDILAKYINSLTGK